MTEELEAYYAGELASFGGGNVEWWQDYIRAELGRAHDFYNVQHAARIESLSAEVERWALLESAAANALTTAQAKALTYKQAAESAEARVRALEEALRYWMPDESMVPEEHRDTWNKHIAALEENRRG